MIKPSFYHRTKTTHRKEEIFAIFKDRGLGIQTREPKEIRKVATHFYKKLWSNRKDTRVHSLRKMNRLINKILRKISEVSNIECNKTITEEEVKQVTKEMFKNKSPGIYGTLAEFYPEFEYVTE